MNYYPGASDAPEPTNDERRPTRTFADDDAPRISSRELARRLGISHRKLLALIEKHRSELEQYGPIVKTRIEEDKP